MTPHEKQLIDELANLRRIRNRAANKLKRSAIAMLKQRHDGIYLRRCLSGSLGNLLFTEREIREFLIRNGFKPSQFNADEIQNLGCGR